jgi:hypothetical protein
MRIYIIGNDGITLCREAPATVNDDEVVVASREELQAAPLSGKRLRSGAVRARRFWYSAVSATGLGYPLFGAAFERH